MSLALFTRRKRSLMKMSNAWRERRVCDSWKHRGRITTTKQIYSVILNFEEENFCEKIVGERISTKLIILF